MDIAIFQNLSEGAKQNHRIDKIILEHLENFSQTDVFSYLRSKNPAETFPIDCVYFNGSEKADFSEPAPAPFSFKNLHLRDLIEHRLSGTLYYASRKKGGWVYMGDFSTQPNVCELHCNLDDVTSEEMGAYQKRLWELNPLDIWVENILMKKSRPAFKLCVLAEIKDAFKFQEWLLENTPTLGLRFFDLRRWVLLRYQRKDEKVWFSLAGEEKCKREFDSTFS